MLLGSTLLAAALVGPAPAPVATEAAMPAPVHCQVPCGIYGDQLRVQLLMEDAATIEKAMKQIAEIGAADSPNWNQLVRWTMTKEEHAQKVQDQLAQYWLAQRIKAPKEMKGDAQRRYMAQLMLNHRMTVSAMKCKQTIDTANVTAFRQALEEFTTVYFTEEDLKHLREHTHGGDDHSHGHSHDKKGR
jgi:hypothetical protein